MRLRSVLGALGRARRAARAPALALWLGLGALGALAASPGCAPSRPDKYLLAFRAGQRAYHAGRYGEAATRFDEAARRADRVKDRDEARFLQARTLQKAGDTVGARAAYERIVRTSPRGPRTVRAEFELASIEIETGDPARGHAMLERTALRHPRHGLARAAILRVAARAGETGGDAARLAYLRGVAPKVRGTPLEQVVAYEQARALERMGELEAARDAFVATAERHPYPFGGLTDDAWWRAAELDEKLGRPAQAIADLERLLAPRESADTMGSYERPRYSAAQMRIAELYRDALRDPAAARRAFRRLYERFPTSILRDDALWEEALLARQTGDGAGACELVEKLLRDFPASRYVGCEKLVCPSTKASPKNARPCPGYLRRRIDPER